MYDGVNFAPVILKTVLDLKLNNPKGIKSNAD
jgi:hypothetical protein